MKNTYHVSGTHCASCKILLEDIIGEQEYIASVNVNLKKETIEIEIKDDKNKEEVLDILNSKIKENGYILTTEKQEKEKQNHRELYLAVPIGIVFLILFFLLQKSGILNFGIGGDITPATSFIIGLIASVSSCLAIVGGLILSLSATSARDDSKTSNKHMILFHLGRLLGFAILGGILGFIGKTIGINFTISTILGLIASIIMIILGMNLVGIFNKNKITLPSGVFSYFRKVEHSTLAPIVVGIGTFFLPCGFTQSMQFSALSSGSFTSGFIIMLFFAFGTLPVLGLLSFSSVSFAKSKYAPIFFKSAGVVVLGLGIFALLAGLASLGIINPIINI
ncbi:MAG: sulfite exporter TauE/SafE family protein [Candidatus Nomurabacteria bacterium]|nr:sulfite exporter TauE/SafE family protein [Candidatus Nomurabacteria bacterium]